MSILNISWLKMKMKRMPQIPTFYVRIYFLCMVDDIVLESIVILKAGNVRVCFIQCMQ